MEKKLIARYSDRLCICMYMYSKHTCKSMQTWTENVACEKHACKE